MSKGVGRKNCINCSADLTFTSTENKPAFFTLNCSTRVRSPLSPATVELVPVHHALATIFNFETLEKVSESKVNIGDQIDIEDDLENESPFKQFHASASTVPICYVCYLVLSDLYRNYTEFSQLRKSNSFYGSKLKELESQLSDHRSQCQQSQTQESFSTSSSGQVPASIQHCQCNLNRTKILSLKNVQVSESFAPSQNTRTSVNSEFVTPDHGHGRDLHSDLNLLPGPTELRRHSIASGNRPFQEKYSSSNSRKSELTGFNYQESQVPCPSVPILSDPLGMENGFSVQESFPNSVKFEVEVASDSEGDPEDILGVTDVQDSSPMVANRNILNSSIPSFDPNSVLASSSTAAPNVTGAIKIVSKRKDRRGLSERVNTLVDQEGYRYLKRHMRQIKGVDTNYWYCDQRKICGASIVEISNEFKAGNKKYWNEVYTQHVSHQVNLDRDTFDREKDECRKSTKRKRKKEPIPLETTARSNSAI